MYFISTKFGLIPNVIDNPSDSLSKDRIFYIDDFFIFHDHVSLRSLCSLKKDIKIYLKFKTNVNNKNKQKRVVTNKRGKMFLNKEEYNKFIDIFNPDYFQDFYSNDIFTNKDGVKINIVDLDSLNKFNNFDYKNIFFGTSFINKIIEENKMLTITDNKLIISESIYDCKCCGNLSEGYFNHLKEMKEINFLYYLTIHNYNVLNKFIKIYLLYLLFNI